ncbi:MAG: hypothetical protein A2802_00710 [Candidatus Woykebacteria bacterium RIFCSPHIGHO2_01_FULL_43_29]|nr:MAG: hypothetical protein A2802_00710 [Candidatus Woykebacteria bacterium RIFCSPHIGHO2_01_FULL_43_29]OGY32002.1 MAG: hypothetical protein A3A61_01120 [Candidatus Woykebacteria bacterium RIFCSPLOWO2_01_FULL_43_14]
MSGQFSGVMYQPPYVAQVYELVLCAESDGRFLEHLRSVLPDSRLILLLGSESDLPRVEELSRLLLQEIKVTVIMSAHRHPALLFALACALPVNTCVVAAGGLSLQLPAMLRAWLNSLGKTIPIFGVGLGDTPELRRIAVEAMTVLPSDLAGTISVKAEDESWSNFAERVRAALSDQDEIHAWVLGHLPEPTRKAKVIGHAFAAVGE